MTAGEITGTVGVSLLLLAFGLNLLNKLSASSKTYLLLNISGAGLACASSYLIGFWPFVVLEAVWMLSSTAILIKNFNHA